MPRYISAGGGGISVAAGAGTTNRLMKFDASDNAADALLSDDGTNVTLASGVLFIADGTFAAPSLARSGEAGRGLVFAAGETAFTTGVRFRTSATESAAVVGTSLIDPVRVGSTGLYGWTSGAEAGAGTLDTFLGRAAAANLRFGAAAANPPVAQTLSVQNASGTDIAGANFTLDLSQGTGTGAGGGLVVRSAAAGGAGSALNALATLLTIGPTNVTLASGTLIIPQATVAATSLRHASAAAGSGWFAGGSANRWRLANVGVGVFEIDPDNAFVQMASNWSLRWRSGTDLAAGDTDTILGRAAAANVRLGSTAANPPVAQTSSVQNASGTDIAGANWTHDGSQGTGTGAGGSHVFRTAAAGSTGSALNSLTEALTIASTGTVTSSRATGGIGYATGAGGTVTQATSKSTGVTLNTVTGEITMNAAALAGDTAVTFTLTNSAIAAGDNTIVQHFSAGTAGSYLINARSDAGSALITVRNVTTGSLSEAIVLKFFVLKAVTS